MAEAEAGLRSARLAEMKEAQRMALISGILSALVGALLTLLVGLLIRKASMARKRDEWLQSGLVGLADAMRGDLETIQLGHNIL
ncbi:hypothetical protein ACSTHS_00285, partial [Vibrio parahaemolyticus]